MKPIFCLTNSLNLFCLSFDGLLKYLLLRRWSRAVFCSTNTDEADRSQAILPTPAWAWLNPLPPTSASPTKVSPARCSPAASPTKVHLHRWLSSAQPSPVSVARSREGVRKKQGEFLQVGLRSTSSGL